MKTFHILPSVIKRRWQMSIFQEKEIFPKKIATKPYYYENYHLLKKSLFIFKKLTAATFCGSGKVELNGFKIGAIWL